MGIRLDFTGIKLKEEFTLGISVHLNDYTPFALKSKSGHVAVFVPKTLSVLFVNKSLAVTKCANKQDFLNLIGLTALSHREFTDIPVQVLALVNPQKQIDP